MSDDITIELYKLREENAQLRSTANGYADMALTAAQDLADTHAKLEIAIQALETIQDSKVFPGDDSVIGYMKEDAREALAKIKAKGEI